VDVWVYFAPARHGGDEAMLTEAVAEALTWQCRSDASKKKTKKPKSLFPPLGPKSYYSTSYSDPFDT